MSIIFKEICINEEILPIYIYIYVYILPLAKIMELTHLEDFHLIHFFFYFAVKELITDKTQDIFFLVESYNSTDTATAWTNFCFIFPERSDFHKMDANFFIHCKIQWHISTFKSGTI